MLQNSGMMGFPVFFRFLDMDEEGTKLHQDRYEMFVNGDYVGNHTLFAEKEDASDISDYLETQGFHQTEVEVQGDHILIHCKNEEEAERIEKALQVYASNR